MKQLKQLFFLFLPFLFVFSACKKEKEEKSIVPPQQLNFARPIFNADSAYQFIQRQVDFGPRVPGTPEHETTANWLHQKLATYTDTAFIQSGEATMYNGAEIPIYNIIGSFNPNTPERILLAAHWDTRHMADKESSQEAKEKPILGANDGGSGVGVLLEIARQLYNEHTHLGIDIIFFDAEDLGSPVPSAQETDDWCLGSQYWGKTPHKPNYKAVYGILLDMVGADDAVFKYESRAYRNAAPLYNKTWSTAHQLGYNYLFIKAQGTSITDDHIYVMEHRKFPMINIIDYDPKRPNGFGHFHHTHQDNMDVISKNTLKAVGETVLATVKH